jgi:hypothetical protein
MAIAVIEVPSKARMANGLSKCLTAGVEYEMLEGMTIEITCADEYKLAKIITAFGGKILSARHQQAVVPSLPRHE